MKLSYFTLEGVVSTFYGRSELLYLARQASILFSLCNKRLKVTVSFDPNPQLEGEDVGETNNDQLDQLDNNNDQFPEIFLKCQSLYRLMDMNRCIWLGETGRYKMKGDL